MPDISKITLPESETTYTLKDEFARQHTPYEIEASGETCTFETNGQVDFIECKSQFNTVTQEEGTPTYDNPKAISGGLTGLTLKHSGANTGNATTYNVTWSTTAGTVYVGEYNFITGILTATHFVWTPDDTIIDNTSKAKAPASAVPGPMAKKSVVFGSLNTSSQLPYNQDISAISTFKFSHGLIEPYDTTSSDAPFILWNSTGDKYIWWVGILDHFNNDLATWKTWAKTQTLQFYFKLQTPLTYNIGTTISKTKDGVNSVWTTNEGDTLYIKTVSCTIPNEAMPTKMNRNNPVGSGSFSMGRTGDIGTKSFAFGNNTESSGISSIALGNDVKATASYTVAMGSAAYATEKYAVALGQSTRASGRNSVAIGKSTHAEGESAVAIGYNAFATGDTSYAEGYNTTASGVISHAEGHTSVASNDGAHAEGWHTTASGSYSHSQGNYTVANHKAQHVFGEHNVPDDSVATATQRGNYVEIVGNGTSANAQSNARTLDWDGNEVLAGNLTINGTTSVGDALNTIPDSASDIPYTRLVPASPIANFNTDLALPLKSCTVEIKPKQASGTPSPSNPLPISGTDTVIVTQTGKNLFDPSVYNSFLQLDGTYKGAANSIVAVKTYLGAYIGKQLTFSIYADLTVSPSPTNVKVAVNINGATTSGNQINSGNAGNSSVTFTPQTENDFILISFGSNGGNSFTFYDIQLEASSTRTAYEAYSATTKTVSLPSTVYGGEVDCIGGSGESKYALCDLSLQSFSTNQTGTNTYEVTTTIVGKKNGTNNILSNMFEYKAWSDDGNYGMRGYTSSNSVAFRFPISEVSTPQAAKDFLVNNGVQLLYELATPTQITLANPIELTAKSGVNNVFGDTDGNTSVEYTTSTQSAIDNSIGQSGIYPVLGTQTVSTNVWTGELHGVSKLYTGLTISYVLPYAPTSSSATLELILDDGTSTGAINVYVSTNRITNHVGVARPIILTYYPKGTLINGGTPNTDDRWVMSAYYDADNNAYNTRLISTNIMQVGANGVFRVTFIMQRSDGRWESIVTSSTSATTKVRNTNGFKLNSLLFMVQSADYAENTYIANGVADDRYASTIDARYTFNIANNATYGLTAGQPVYLVGAINPNDGLFYLDSTWWTQTLPSTEDGKLYIQVATAYDYYRIANALADKRIYHYKNGAVREYLPYTEVQEFVDNYEPLIVNFTFADEGDWDGSGQMDITYTELLDAIDNNRPIIANAVTGNTTSANYYSEYKGLKFVGMVIEGQQLYQQWGFYLNYCAIFSLTGWVTTGNSRAVAPRIIMIDWLKGQTNLSKNSLNLSDFKIYFKKA